MKISGPIQLERPPISEAGVRVFFACGPPVDSRPTKGTETNVNLGEGSVCFCQD